MYNTLGQGVGLLIYSLVRVFHLRLRVLKIILGIGLPMKVVMVSVMGINFGNGNVTNEYQAYVGIIRQIRAF